jgi:hypothetical protein
MHDDQQPEVVQAELLPPSTEVAAARNDKGQFAPGHPAGLRKGSLNRVSRAMQQELAAELEAHGVDANPLVILSRIARSTEYHPAIRVQAADRLARYLAPRLMQIELEAPDATFEIETQKIRSTLRTLFMKGDQE